MCVFLWLYMAVTTVGCNHTECHVCFPTVQTRTGLMSPYIWEYCMWQPANCLEGRPCACVCLRVCTCVAAFLHACSTLSQTLRWADRSVALQKHRALLNPASPPSRAHTKNGETNKLKYTKRGGSSLQRCPLHFCFILSFRTSAILAMLPLCAPVE